MYVTLYGPTDEAENDYAITLSMFTFTLLRKSLQKRIPQTTKRCFSEIKVMSEKALGRGKSIVYEYIKSDNFRFLKRNQCTESTEMYFTQSFQIKIENI